MGNIRLHKKYGLNPAIPKCFVCGKDKNKILLLGAGCKEEAPKNQCFDKEPCDKCQEYMKNGTILISVRDGEDNVNNPYRTGGWCVVKNEAMKKIVNDYAGAKIMFVEDKVWDKLKLPRGENT